VVLALKHVGRGFVSKTAPKDPLRMPTGEEKARFKCLSDPTS
jgi:hypothetical protein